MAVQCLFYFGLGIPLLFLDLFFIYGLYILRHLKIIEPTTVTRIEKKVFRLASFIADTLQNWADFMAFFGITSLIAVLIDPDKYSIYHLQMVWNLAYLGTTQIQSSFSSSNITFLRLRFIVLQIVNDTLFVTAVKKSLKRYDFYDPKYVNNCYRALPRFHDDTGLGVLYDAILSCILDVVSILFDVISLLEQYRPDRGEKNFNGLCWKILCALGIYIHRAFLYSVSMALFSS